MCFPFSTDTDVDEIACGNIFLLDTTAVEMEHLTLQNVVQMKSRASTDLKGEFWHLLSEGKYQKMCLLPEIYLPT